jgi:hypothetical protein
VRGAARQHALHHGFELVERGLIDRRDPRRRHRVVAIDDSSIPFMGR